MNLEDFTSEQKQWANNFHREQKRKWEEEQYYDEFIPIDLLGRCDTGVTNQCCVEFKPL